MCMWSKRYNFQANSKLLDIAKLYNLGFLNLTFSYSPQNKNTRLFNYPVRVEEQTLQEWEEMGQEVIPENIGQNVQSCSWTLSC